MTYSSVCVVVVLLDHVCLFLCVADALFRQTIATYVNPEQDAPQSPMIHKKSRK